MVAKGGNGVRDGDGRVIVLDTEIMMFVYKWK